MKWVRGRVFANQPIFDWSELASEETETDAVDSVAVHKSFRSFERRHDFFSDFDFLSLNKPSQPPASFLIGLRHPIKCCAI